MEAATFLAGVRVLDLSIWRPGPYATSLLVSLGADVLKVEPPGGDPMRHYVGLFEVINAGKRSVELDLKDDQDRARGLELATAADVVVEGFRPGVMSRLGLDYDVVRQLNPGVVYCSISGYGQTGPRAPLPGHDVNYQAWAGALSPEGGPAHMPPLPIADLASGLTGAFGICAALFGRRATAEGTHLDVSMTDVMATWTGPSGSDASPSGARETGETGEPGATGEPDKTEESGASQPVPGYGLFTTADGGQVALGVVNEDHFWSRLCESLDLGQLAGLGFAQRTARGNELQEVVRTSVSTRQRDELVAALIGAGVPASPVLDRHDMLRASPLPGFPIDLPLPVVTGPVPRLDQHRGEGFS
jgi:crotonobetainyl-CoA:carnitine CoA-transferase CaiB-like acyl-CoA transferase